MAAKGGVSDIADRYAHALFDLADENKQLDAVAEDLRTLSALIAESDDMTRLVRSPVLSRQEQGKAMAALLDKMEASDLTQKFVALVAAKRRLFALPAIARAYLEELARRRGEVVADVTVAQELSDQQKEALEAALKQAVGGKVSMDLTVDPSLLGGLVVKVGSHMVDSSLSGKLQRLKFAMKGA
ncbi:F0F1 ATP synthase subunit delta [Marivibrio halodurans]|uniref:ATP synthase subunit delta n=1 Tax=Marivibrio halodurans TaxID=2039722 RepID=A0A8J7SBK1_9PROT|nr:F0F1 ATP synthase subunit delta [Marivibrio halodurans]